MARDDGRGHVGQFAIYQMQISSAHAAGPDTDADFPSCRTWIGRVSGRELDADLFQHHGAHVKILYAAGHAIGRHGVELSKPFQP